MRTLKLEVFGIVQGVGFRPFVARLAAECVICGTVANKGSYVEIFAQCGAPDGEAALCLFQRRLSADSPERSFIMKTAVEELDMTPFRDFSIIESERQAGDIFVSPDIGICQKCLAELRDPKDRRYLHPFINCTACGPRLTILDSMPYDRVRTSMGTFPMCERCHAEYVDPATRRYDAQPVCCHDCGPQVFLLDNPAVRGSDAVSAARRAIMARKIGAVKGIGGFHLCCDAHSDAAVFALRARKRRPGKAFAVMLRDMEAVRRACVTDADLEAVLDDWQKPIVLLDRKPGGDLSGGIAPDNPRIGVMLPYAPLHVLLFELPDGLAMTDALVMTSGNVSGAPICRTDDDVRRELGSFCDMVLTHDRRIRLRADDSVLERIDGRPSMIRRSRGYAPLPQVLTGTWPGQVLGIGGELKNTFCLGRNGLFYLSPHIGDMGDIRTIDALRESLVRMEDLLEIRPDVVACDGHPRYNTVAVARSLGLPVIEIQHHFAHVVSCLAENDFCGKVIGVSFDGTGYGTDGTVWGGEFLLADPGSFARMGSVMPFPQTGGDAAVREGWRIAASMLQAVHGTESARELCADLALCGAEEARMQTLLTERRLNSIASTSAGRLFDAVSAMLGLRLRVTYEGEASMQLQFAAERWLERNGKPDVTDGLEADGDAWDGPLLESAAPVTEDSAAAGDANAGMLFRLPTLRLADAVARWKREGLDVDMLAWRFHRILARMVVAGCVRMRGETGVSVCALSGGVFQNRLFTTLCAHMLEAGGFTVLRHSLVPPNDGGLALGQAVAAAWRLARGGA